MNLYCETERLVMQVLPAYYNHQVLQFFMENKEHLEPWEAQRDKNFYTANYQRALLEAEYNQMVHKKMLRYYLFLKENPDCIVGSVCANNIRYGAFENCSIGYKIHKQYCKQGYGKESVEKLINILFSQYGMHRIEAMVHPKNQPSIALLESVGFEREGIAREAARLSGSWQDMYRYSLLQKREEE